METIDLDCPPGNPRPCDLLPAVIEGTILEGKNPFDTVSRLFGNWCWAFDVDRETWINEVQPVIRPRIKALHDRGIIRYGSW